MKKCLKIAIIILIILIFVIIGYIGFIKYQEYKEEMRIKNAIIKIEFVDSLKIPFNSNIKVSDLITSINGEYITNPIIDTSIVGMHEVSFKYLNEENIKVPYSFYVDIVDNVAPVVLLGNSYTITKGSSNFKNKIFCADNYDDNPKCEIKGEYDVNTLGNYNLTYEASDFSGNITKKEFVLNVVNASSSGKRSSSSASIPFKSLYNEYKKENTKIGIDVSKWQGTIDYEKVKNEGVEFVFIKLGGSLGIGKEYYLDPKFKDNYEGFKKVGIPIGLYFYSYANSVSKARQDALWVIEQIKGYDIDLPIAFDWENWSNYNDFHMSFNTLTNSANMFMKTIKDHGYETMLYSSKNYLVNYWLKKDYPVWLAHYTNKTDYAEKFVCWQRTSLAKISGITENTVDFDICYTEE